MVVIREQVQQAVRALPDLPDALSQRQQQRLPLPRQPIRGQGDVREDGRGESDALRATLRDRVLGRALAQAGLEAVPSRIEDLTFFALEIERSCAVQHARHSTVDRCPVASRLQAETTGFDVVATWTPSNLDGDTSFLTGADPRLSAPFLEGFATAAVAVYIVCLVVVLTAFGLSFFLKAPPLRTKSAIEEVADADAAIAAQLAADAAPVASDPGPETTPILAR